MKFSGMLVLATLIASGCGLAQPGSKDDMGDSSVPIGTTKEDGGTPTTPTTDAGTPAPKPVPTNDAGTPVPTTDAGSPVPTPDAGTDAGTPPPPPPPPPTDAGTPTPPPPPPPPVPATLRVVTIVVNDNGGTAAAANFAIEVKSVTTGAHATNSPANGSSVGTSYALDAGAYALAVSATTGYAVTIGADCSANGAILLASGETKLCTFTLNDIALPPPPPPPPPAKSALTVITTVVNDNGGTATPADLTVTVVKHVGGAFIGSGPGFTAGVTYVLDPLAYDVAPSPKTGYVITVGGDCAVGGTITLLANDAKTCTVTANDIAPPPPPPPVPATLKVVTVVVNDNGGFATASSFTARVMTGSTGPDVAGSPAAGMSAPGTSYLVNAGTYYISATAKTGYAITVGTDCAANGSITLASGNVKTCTVTANDIAPPPPPPPPAKPVISMLTVSNIGFHKAQLDWKTDMAADSYVTCYGTDPGGWDDIVDLHNDTKVTSHTVYLTGLQAGMEYECSVSSMGVGTPVAYLDISFITKSAPSVFRSNAPWSFQFHKAYIGGSTCGEMRGNMPGISWTAGIYMNGVDAAGYLTASLHAPAGRHCFTYTDAACPGQTLTQTTYAAYGNLSVASPETQPSAVVNIAIEDRGWLFATQYDATKDACVTVPNPGLEICVDIDANGVISQVEDQIVTDRDGNVRQNLEAFNLTTTGCN